MSISSIIFFSMSLFKMVPRLSQNIIFKKFTVLQALTGIAAYSWYFYQIHHIGSTIPK